MLNAIPLFGWFLSIFFSMSVSVPFYFLWNHLCPKYLPFIQMPYSHLPFWDCVGIFMLISILKSALTPQFASITQTNEAKED